MKRYIIWVLLGLVLAGGGVTLGVRASGVAAEKGKWRKAKPVTPDITQWPMEFQRGIQACETRLRHWPPEVDALADLARLYLANGFTAQGEQALRALIFYQPGEPRWPHYLATALAGEGRLEEAVVAWKETIAVNGSYLPAKLKIAEALRKLNRREEAISAYQEVLRQNANNGYALLGLAVIEVEAEHWAEAKKILETAITADSSFFGAVSLLSTVAERLGDSTLAERARRRANEIGRFKDVPDPWWEELTAYCFDVYRLQVAAATLGTTGNLRAALLPLQRAVQLDPANARTRRHLGQVFFALDDLPNAREQFRQAISLDPAEPQSYLEMEKVFKAGKDLAGAETLLNEGLLHCENDPGIQREYALVLIAEKRVDDAVPHLERARDLAPEDLGIYETLSMAYFRLGRSSDGVATFDQGLKRQPNNAPLLLLKGRYEIQAGNDSAAENQLRLAREHGADTAEVQETAGLFERRFGRPPR